MLYPRYLIHTPFYFDSPEKLQKAWADMEAVQKAGKAKSIGVSNFLQSHLETLLAKATVTPVINQIEFHPYLQRKDLVPWCQSKQIAVSAYAPLPPVLKGAPGPADALLQQLARKHAVNESEVLLRWCIEQDVIPITTSSKEQRMSDYLRVAAIKLTPKDVEELKSVGAEKHYRGFWAKYFDENDRS